LNCLPLAILGFLSATLILWQWRAAIRFPLGQRNRAVTGAVPITVLKPIKGGDAETEACLESWLNQDHPGPVQVLFGLSTPHDPAVAVVRRLIERYPDRDLSLVITSERLGMNGKISSLIHLARLARHDLLVVSDADVRVPSDLLRQLAIELGEARNALVCCLYRLANPTTTAMHWEAVAINCDFWSQVLQARTLAPLDFALGATMALHREALNSVGGFESFADQLADDFQLGHRLVRDGGKIRLAPIVVECWEPPRGWTEVWRHQLRWARTIRTCRPGPYFLSILANGTLWPLLWLAASGPWTGPGPSWAWLGGIACLLIRATTAWDQQRRFSGGSGHRAPWWMPWFKDLAQVLLWAGAFLGRTVEWRGERYRVLRGGRMMPVRVKDAVAVWLW
jgi:ceramide glucosyltransferase